MESSREISMLDFVRYLKRNWHKALIYYNARDQESESKPSDDTPIEDRNLLVSLVPRIADLAAVYPTTHLRRGSRLISDAHYFCFICQPRLILA